MEVLLNHDYPGNIRELENILEHALIICQADTIERKHLPLSLQKSIPSDGTRQQSEPSHQEPASHYGEKQRIFAEFEYAAGTWDRQRRVIVKAERLKQGPNLRFVVTNLPGDPQELYDDLYCQRGDMENRIKEQQLGLFADRTSCHYFLPNQFRLLLSAAAYVLMETLRRIGLKGTDLAKAQVNTIRLKLLKIGARVRCSVRRIVLHLASGYPLQNLFRQIVTRLTQLPTSDIVFR